MSSAERGLESDPVFAPLGAVGWSRNGFLDTGRRGGSSKGDGASVACFVSVADGEAALLRNGLFEDRLAERWPGRSQ